MSKKRAYFNATNKGEIGELKYALSSTKETVKVEAVKRIIAAMTVGKDVSALFPNVVKCIHTDNLELKKLVYLYVMNYSKTQPELAILAVNTFVQDAENRNPLIRALAIRSMGCIRVKKITEYLCEPLRATLKDKDPYVRKTAAICVAKLADIDYELVQDQGFLDKLHDLLTDGNSMVVANAVAALSEINAYSERPAFRLSSRIVQNLLPALDACTEWGQIFILNALGDYEPRDSKEAEMACERVVPRLNHANSAVVLGAVKVILNYLDFIDSDSVYDSLLSKLAPPLITLISRRPEIQYVALRNINLIVQKKPTILARQINVFFCKYNDPIYVKLEKLEICLALVSADNLEKVLLELKEYATEVDVEFVRRAVRAIGRCAIKLESEAQRCVKVLLELIQTKVNYVVQEAVVVLKDVFRRYPNKYETVIATLCENLDSLDEPRAKAAMIWILGEYSQRIENADELLDQFLDNFLDEPASVQLQLLTAIVKLFLDRPKDTQDMVTRVLDYSTRESDNPDLRDRGYVYWRLLAASPSAAKAVVLAEKPVISDESDNLERNLLNELLRHIGSLASVYHKPPSTFVTKLKGFQRSDYRAPRDDRYSDEEDSEGAGGEGNREGAVQQGDLIGLQDLAQALPPMQDAPGGGGAGGLADLGFLQGAAAVAAPVRKRVLFNGKGLQVSGAWVRRQGAIHLDLALQNTGVPQMGGFAVQFNVNSFGLTPPPGALSSVPVLLPNVQHEISLPISTAGQKNPPPLSRVLQVAIKFNQEVVYFSDNVPFHVLLEENGYLEGGVYLNTWAQIPDQCETMREMQGLQTNPDHIKTTLGNHHIFFVAQRKVENQDVLYFSASVNGSVILTEITHRMGAPLQVCTRTTDQSIVTLFVETIEELLRNPQ